MIQRILVANRGEIALRVIRACHELGIETVAVYSEADRDATYLQLADRAICIGPGPSKQSYLDIPRIMTAAENTNADAIHPGYGFLSENAHVAEICRESGITFIGPEPATINRLGHKSNARELAIAAKVPVVPGSDGTVPADDATIKALARKLGFPVLIKAVAGGGGRGMRVASSELALLNAFHAARAEAESAFKNPDVYIEKYLAHPRHVEIQIIADKHGNTVHLGERDCSIQRRHQKLVEESPSTALTPELRAEMGEAAVRLVKSAGYINAGTVEFLVENGKYYFIEVNTRIQVEHPVTEMVTGIDLIQAQISVANGEKLPFTQDDITFSGHAIECRINAEDHTRNFAPSPGRITDFRPPGGFGVRFDSHAYAGYMVPPNYDSMIGKLIVHRKTRQEAIDGMARALAEFRVEGIKTTIPLYRELMKRIPFREGKFDTHYIEENLL
jgi:acetyl-CoA carboxylase biotin carboxylase subunit